MDYSVHFNDLEDLDLVREYEHTQQIFEQLLTNVTEGMQESDLICFDSICFAHRSIGQTYIVTVYACFTSDT